MWVKLFFDKFIGFGETGGSHSYTHSILGQYNLDDFEDGTFTFLTGKAAFDYYDVRFRNYFKLPDIVGSNLYKINLYHKVTQNQNLVFTIILVNSVLLENLVLEGKNIPQDKFLKLSCRYHKFYNSGFGSFKSNDNLNDSVEYMIQKAMCPVDYVMNLEIEQPEWIKVNLYKYQRCSIRWMLEKESNKRKISFSLGDEIEIGNVCFDLHSMTQNFYHKNDRKSLTFNGGGLIDEVGLGKTLQIIALGCLNKSKCNDMCRGGKFYSKATLVLCPNQLCGQWIREFKDKINNKLGLKVISILTKRDFDKLSYEDILNADFVIVSFTFLDNKVFTTPWVEKVSSIKSFHRQRWNKNDTYKIANVFSNMEKSLIVEDNDGKYAGLKEKGVMLQLIHWHRIVIDEFHEVYKSSGGYQYIANLLPFIKADYRWIVSATPFGSPQQFFAAVEFLSGFENVDGTDIFKVEGVLEYMAFNCFRRNTKESVKEEYRLPPIVEEIKWMKFSMTERVMYNAYLANGNNDKYCIYLRQLCCHPQLADETKDALANCKTLEDIEKMMIVHYQGEVDVVQEKYDKLLERIGIIEEKIEKHSKKLEKKGGKFENISFEDLLDDCEDDDITTLVDTVNNMKGTVLERLLEILDGLNKKLKQMGIVLEGKKSSLNFFTNVVNKIKKTLIKDQNAEEEDEESCGICFDRIPEDGVGVTKCGHIFCFECLGIAVSKTHTCPLCRGRVEGNEYYQLSYQDHKKDSNRVVEKDKMQLINEFGTKLANLITFVRETNEHTIIFSQWDDLLKKVGRILADNGIKNVFCKGNCYQRDKAIREFNSDDKIKVIMLSSESTASGTNLTKATRVVFLDPIYGAYDYRKGQERQAIGRAHRLGQNSVIKVVRFIIRESVEEDIYKTNISVDAQYKTDIHIHSVIEVDC